MWILLFATQEINIVPPVNQAMAQLPLLINCTDHGESTDGQELTFSSTKNI